MIKIIEENEKPTFFTDERCYIKELFNYPEHNQSSLAKAIVEPGVTTQLHALKNTAELYYILKGRGSMVIDSKERILSVGTCIFIPQNYPQQITNVGEENLEFLCICTPRFTSKVYLNLEEE
ncbi:MAG: cupin domain-containing protein [Bacteroidota bacterium]